MPRYTKLAAWRSTTWAYRHDPHPPPPQLPRLDGCDCGLRLMPMWNSTGFATTTAGLKRNSPSANGWGCTTAACWLSALNRAPAR